MNVKNINIGCGSDIKAGWENVDILPISGVTQCDVTKEKLPFESNSAGKVLCQHLLEHIRFTDEKHVMDEIHRVLMPGGELWISVPNFLWLCKEMCDSIDEWTSFYKVTKDYTDKDYGFGGGPGNKYVHGELMTCMFGNQTADGQYHHNGYTEGKIRGIAKLYKYRDVCIYHTYYKGSDNLVATMWKQ